MLYQKSYYHNSLSNIKLTQYNLKEIKQIQIGLKKKLQQISDTQIKGNMQEASNRPQKQLQGIRDQIELIENDRDMYQQQKQWLFRQLGTKITFLLDHLKDDNEQCIDDGKQQQDTAIETYDERNYFIEKLHEKDKQIEIMKLRINEYERRENELQGVISSKDRQLQQLKTPNHNRNGQQLQQSSQQQPVLNHQKQQFLNKRLSQIQKQRDVKIQQLKLMQKHIQHMKLIYDKQTEELLISNKAQIQRVIKEKDLQIIKTNDKLGQQRTVILQQLASHQLQLQQLTERHRNDIDLVRSKYQKDIIKLTSKHQYEIDQLKSDFEQYRKQSISKSKQLESKVQELEEKVQRYDDDERKRVEQEEEKNGCNNNNNGSNLETNKETSEKILQLTEKLEQQSKLFQQKSEQLKNYQQQHLITTNQLKQQNIKVTTANRFLQSKNIDLFNQLQKVTRTYQETNIISNKRIQYLQNQIQQYKIQIQQYKKQISTLNFTIQGLKNQSLQKNIKLESLDRQLQRTKNYNQILLSDIKFLSSDVKTLNIKIHELDQSNIEIKKAMLTSRKDLQNKRSKQGQSRILTKSALECLTDRSNNSQCCYQGQKVGQTSNIDKQQQQIQQQQQSNLHYNHQSMRIDRKDDSMIVNNSSNRNNLSLVIDRKDKDLTLIGRNENSLIIERINNSIVMQRNNNSMVMQRKDRSLISSRRHSPLSDNQSKSKYPITVTEQFKKRRAQRQQQIKQQLVAQSDYKQQGQLQHIYSMQTTFSPMPTPNIKPTTDDKINNIIQISKKQRQDKMNLFRKKNQRLANYRQRIRKQKDAATTIKKKVQMNVNNQGMHNNGGHNTTNASQQFKSLFTAYEQKKNQLNDQNNKTTTNILKTDQSKQILIEENTQREEDNCVRHARNTHSSLQGEYQYQALQLTFKPKSALEDSTKKLDRASSKTFMDNNLMTYSRSDSIESKSKSKDSNRYLSLNSSFEDQNSITQENIQSNNLRPSTKEKIMRQLPVHLLIGK